MDDTLRMKHFDECLRKYLPVENQSKLIDDRSFTSPESHPMSMFSSFLLLYVYLFSIL